MDKNKATIRYPNLEEEADESLWRAVQALKDAIETYAKAERPAVVLRAALSLLEGEEEDCHVRK